jgi:hypothetical protein
MEKFVVSFVIAGRDSSILETDLCGKEIVAAFSDFQADKGGTK